MMMPLILGLTSGIPPVIGKRLLLSFEKGRPVTSVFATIPATTLADGCDPPRMSCMKKDNDGSFATGFAVTGGVTSGTAGTSASGCGISGVSSVVVGLATGGIISSAGAVTAAGASVSGTEGSALTSSSVVGIVEVAAGVWPLGKVVVMPIWGMVVVVVTGLVVTEGLAAPGPGRLPMAWGWVSTSSRILAELAIKKVVVRSKRQRVALQG